jgi:glycosyltransferase involved in cell wall biosynthesis
MGGDGAGALGRAIGDFAPEAVLTVVHLYQWQGAAAYAKERGLPLHLISHDRWQDVFFGSAATKARIAPRFAAAYRQAKSRFCVSPHMAEIYEAETGAKGDVLYPARRRGYQAHATVSPRVAIPGLPFTVAYAGSIADPGQIAALASTARALRSLGGRLLVFGPYTGEQLAGRGLAGENVVIGGSIPPHELADRLRAEADVLAASVGFDERYLPAMELCFPSKLTDYTAAGVPILAHGPPTCSAVRWAKDNPNVAEIVETMDEAPLRAALERLMRDEDRRRELAQTALDVGGRQFAGDVAEQRLFAALVAA